jgi:hypothetical protein
MTPEQFAQLQQAIAENSAEQTKLLRGIRQDIKILGIGLVLAILVILGLSA